MIPIKNKTPAAVFPYMGKNAADLPYKPNNVCNANDLACRLF